jgi:WD40-like Beta Propeller Repeat
MSALLRRAPRALLLAAIAWALAGVAVARADVFEPISLLSIGQPQDSSFPEQAAIAEHPAISANGRYVAFDGIYGGVRGLWRVELATSGTGRVSSGTIEEVAGGDAELPSISENGQLISFTTSEGASLPAITNDRPDEHPKQEALNVYVRNMAVHPEASEAFVPASAVTVNGQTQPLTYSNGEADRTGSVAAGRSAISANGEYVAFVTTAESNLADPGGPATTPALQVAVRDIPEKTTKLVSVEYEQGKATERPVATSSNGNVTVGAAYQPPVPTSGFEAIGTLGSSLGASISAESRKGAPITVAWMGQQIARQAPTFATAPEDEPEYREPLWRRLDEGSQAPTRRVTGGADPTAPACVASGEQKLSTEPSLSDPCQGPFDPNLESGDISAGIYPNGANADFVPRLSANGLTVAFLATQRPIAEGQEFATAQNSDDLYVANMEEGLTRVHALRRLTEIAGGNPNLQGEIAPIADFDISPDGSQVAFSTLRTAFPLGTPAFVSAPEAVPAAEEIYDADLADNTLTRVTHGYEGETQQTQPPGPLGAERQAGSPSFSADGSILVFSSFAGNLVFGEDNRANSVFAVSRKRFQPEEVPQYISPEPATAPPLEPAWLLDVTAQSRADGAVVLEIEAPGPGRIDADADGAVRVSVGKPHASSRRHARRARAAGRTTAAALARRRVASVAKSVGSEELVKLTLTLSAHYQALATQRDGFSADLTVVFAAPGHPTLRQTVPIVFHRTLRPVRASAKPKGRR